MANGYLQKPKLPGIPGIASFQGHTFHTSRWDYDYTGGDLELAGRQARRHHRHRRHRGAVRPAPGPRGAVSCSCSSAPRRRSTSATTGRPTRSGRPVSTPGWQRRRIENFQQLTAGGDADEDLVADAWTSIVKTLSPVMRRR